MAAIIGGVTSEIVKFALDGLSLRHQAIASNIANADAVGYRPVNVSFESKIAELQSQSSSVESGAHASTVTPEVSFSSPITVESNRRALEANVVLLNQNVIQYQSLIKGLEKYMASITEAIKEGRR